MPITLVDPHLRGAARTKEIILEATADLLAQRPPSLVRISDIATEAQVNHGLINHYFGSKEALVQAAFVRMGDQVAAIADERIASAIAGDAGSEVALRSVLGLVFDPDIIEGRRFFRAAALVAAVDDTSMPEALKGNFPVIRVLRRLGGPLFQMSQDVSDTWAALAGTMVLGWFILEPSVLGTTQLDRESARNSLLQTVIDLAYHISGVSP